MDAARHALRRVERDVVLHRTEIRQAQRGHLRTLPVLLEPAAVIAMHRQIEHQKPRDVRLRDLQLLLEIKHHTRSLSLLLVLGFGSGLRGLPPVAVVRVPLDGLFQALLEVRVRRLPAELLAAELYKLAALDRFVLPEDKTEAVFAFKYLRGVHDFSPFTLSPRYGLHRPQPFTLTR